MQIQPFLLDDGLALGTVYGTLLNQQATVQRLSPLFDSAPYKAAPRAPVLYLKPRNTWARDGVAVAVPADPGEVRVDAGIGLVIGRSATRVDEATALDHVAGWLIASDLTLAHETYYPPSASAAATASARWARWCAAQALTRRRPRSRCPSMANRSGGAALRTWCARPQGCWPT
jgi:2-keto-4-pentenoate hydratase/2-oxohepta-3-ene-1,7-dioic acid hydratase in catechol pathway